jgi:hypothetical protein
VYILLSWHANPEDLLVWHCSSHKDPVQKDQQQNQKGQLLLATTCPSELLFNITVGKRICQGYLFKAHG